jgi:hypothetical protein
MMFWRSAKPGVMALLLVVAVDASAQAYRPASPDFLGHALEREREADLQALDAFARKRSTEGARSLERPAPWTLYGRLGLVNFQNELDGQGSGTQFSWRRTGPGLTGRIYIGIRRRF